MELDNNEVGWLDKRSSLCLLYFFGTWGGERGRERRMTAAGDKVSLGDNEMS